MIILEAVDCDMPDLKAKLHAMSPHRSLHSTKKNSFSGESDREGPLLSVEVVSDLVLPQYFKW